MACAERNLSSEQIYLYRRPNLSNAGELMIWAICPRSGRFSGHLAGSGAICSALRGPPRFLRQEPGGSAPGADVSKLHS